tara:strand:- start:1448 stop:1678 length:231 start_codon:yes stop_codon:yes gene_type:complete
MGNICIKGNLHSEQSIPLTSLSGLSIQSSNYDLDNPLVEKSSRISDKVPDSKLEDYLTDSQEYNDTIALAYLFSVI